MSDIEAQAPVSLNTPVRLIRNRTLFAIFDITLLLLNSFWAHGRMSRALIEVPSIEIFPFLKRLDNTTKSFSDALVAKIDNDNAIIRLEINTTLEREINRTDGLLSLNDDKIRVRKEEERDVRRDYHHKVTYLQAWSRVGNAVPYKPNTSSEDQLALQTMLNLENGAIIQELSEESTSLGAQLSARYQYDMEYLHNKTAGLIPKLIPKISASMQIPDLNVQINATVMKAFDNLVTELRPIRDYIANVYSSLSSQLLETGLAFDAMALKYDELIKTISHFYQILDSINVVGLNTNIFPRVDLNTFPPPNFYLPDSITFPEVQVFLKPFDDILLHLQDPFDLMAFNILNIVDDNIDMKIEEIMAAMIDALTPDDYFPPTIRMYGQSMSLPDALVLNSEITANLTMQANQIPNSPIPTEPPDVSIPRAEYKPQNFDFAKPVADLFTWSIPNLNPFTSLLREVLLFLWLHYVKVEVFLVNMYRAMRRAYEYFEGTAVPLPMIDLRIKAEQEDGVVQKQSKIQFISRYIFDPMLGSILTQLIPFAFFALIVLVGYNYYFGEFHPKCIMSQSGTSVGNFAVGPFLYNRALAAGQKHAIDLSIGNNVYVQGMCQSFGLNVLNSYGQQVIDFEESRVKTIHDLTILSEINKLVNLEALCEQHQLACADNDPDLICPSVENGAVVDNPCSFVTTDIQIIPSTLESVDFSCNAVPRGELSLNGTRDQVEKELLVEENWCVVEWYYLGHAWRLVFVIMGYIVVGQAFHWIIQGLHTFLWNKFRPEWFEIQCTADRKGVFTQPEYSDQEAKAEAIREWLFSNKFLGAGKLIFGAMMLAGWVLIALKTWQLQMVPSWYRGPIASQ